MKFYPAVQLKANSVIVRTLLETQSSSGSIECRNDYESIDAFSEDWIPEFRTTSPILRYVSGFKQWLDLQKKNPALAEGLKDMVTFVKMQAEEDEAKYGAGVCAITVALASAVLVLGERKPNPLLVMMAMRPEKDRAALFVSDPN